VDSEQDPFVILELNLANTNLTGELSSGLTLFDVSRNIITSHIPNELWTQRYALQELHLYQNRLMLDLQDFIKGIKKKKNEKNEKKYEKYNRWPGNHRKREQGRKHASAEK